MKRATVRDLRYRFPEVERLLRSGEPVEITRRGKLIGTLIAADPAPPARPLPPGFVMDRLRRIYGDQKMKISGAAWIRRERDSR
ncbi:MAG: type II toxin-antitoxin system Phd/YefM family antitoxin [Terriglobales bacterium]